MHRIITEIRREKPKNFGILFVNLCAFCVCVTEWLHFFTFYSRSSYTHQAATGKTGPIVPLDKYNGLDPIHQT